MNATLVLGMALSLAAPGPKDKPNPAEGLVGLWELESSQAGRPQAPQKRDGPVRYRFDKDGTFTVLEGDKETVGARPFKFDPNVSPATFELKIDRGPFVVLGIYKIEGDKLTTCSGFPGKERPTRFEVEPGSETSLKVFRRVKKKD